MKTGNFPGKKNARRAVALSRLNDRGSSDTVEAKSLRKALMTPDAARAVRTKIRRGA